MPPLVLLLLGLVALIAGAELVVRSGSRLAARLGIPPLVIGLTVVSIGTSAPELAVGIDAIHNGAGSLAVGNIAGTNVVNILLLLGLTAAIRPLALDRQTLRLDLPAIVVASLLFFGLSLDGELTTLDGAVLLAAAVAYTAVLILMLRRQRRRSADGAEAAARDARTGEALPAPGGTEHPAAFLIQIALLVVSLVVIVKGADWLVTGAEQLARAAGVSDAFIGLTIVAIGTSAPELATTLISTIRGERDIAIGNLIGSSTFNLTLVLGASLVLTPGTVPIAHELVVVDIPIMVLVSLICIPVFLTGRRVSRAEGWAFMAGYAAYFAFLIMSRT